MDIPTVKSPVLQLVEIGGDLIDDCPLLWIETHVGHKALRIKRRKAGFNAKVRKDSSDRRLM